MKKLILKHKNILLSFLCILATTCYYPIFMYCANVQEASFSEVMPAISLFSTIALLICLFTFVCTKNNLFSTLTSVSFVLFAENYKIIETVVRKIFPMLKYWHIVPIGFVLLLHIVYFLDKKIKKENQLFVIQVIAFAFAGLIFMNLGIATPSIIEKKQVSQRNKESKTQTITSETGLDLPNVYYLLFDEYSNFDMIEKYYDYDNYEFAEFLEDRNFSVSYDTLNEDSQTITVFTNFLNLDYIVHREDSVSLKEDFRFNNYLFQLLLEHGYEINVAGQSEIVGRPSVTNDVSRNASTEDGYSFYELLLQQSIFYPFISRSINMQEIVHRALNYFSEESNYTLDSPTFTLLYLCSPHAPFVFDQNGNSVATINSSDYNMKQYYLDQYIYITKEMETLVDNIIKYDQDSVILLQSDHAVRLEEMTPEDKARPLNAVYYRGEDFMDINGVSTVNTNRLVFSRLLEVDLPVLDVPDIYVLPTSKWYETEKESYSE